MSMIWPLDIKSRPLWIGMNSIGKTAFAWINSAAMGVVNWASGMPTSGKKEACVAIKHESHNFSLNVTN
jgi:hypothetical protein